MRRPFAIVGLLVLSCCQQVSDAADHTISPPEAYAHFSDRFRAQLLHWGIAWKAPCVDEASGSGPAVAVTVTPDGECFRFMPPRRFHGLWRDDPKGSRFCPGIAAECTQDSPGTKIRLEADYPVVELPRRGANALYEIDFIGRQTAHPGIYNHLQFGDYPQEIVVERMLAMKELQPPQDAASDGTLK